VLIAAAPRKTRNGAYLTTVVGSGSPFQTASKLGPTLFGSTLHPLAAEQDFAEHARRILSGHP